MYLDCVDSVKSFGRLKLGTGSALYPVQPDFVFCYNVEQANARSSAHK